MNTGIIASRYAKALHRYVTVPGEADRVCRQAMILGKALGQVPGLQKVLDDASAVEDREKMQLLRTALGGEAMAEPLERFLLLVARNGRFPELRFILRDYIDLYYKSRGIHFASLTTAVPASPALLDKIRTEAAKRLGGEVVLDPKVDPDLIGGAIVTVDGWQLDASVRSQLRTLQNQFTNKNKRIV